MSALSVLHKQLTSIGRLEVHWNPERWKVLRHAVLVTAFEIVFQVLHFLLNPARHWGDLLMQTPGVLVIALILFFLGVRDNFASALVPLDTNNVDPLLILTQKVEVFPSVVNEAAYESLVRALHSLPDRIGNWEDSVKVLKGVHQCSHGFVSLVLEKYSIWHTTQNLPTSIVMDEDSSRLSTMFKTFESDALKALGSLPDETPHRQGIINTATSLHQALHLFESRVSDGFNAGIFASQTKSFFLRLCQLFCHPSQFALVFSNFFLLVYSFWEGTQSGPEVILPVSSPTRRPSLRLSRLLLHFCRDLPQYESRADISSSGSSQPRTVAVIDLKAVPREFAEGRYTTGADVYGLTSMLFLVQTLNLLLSPSWIMLFYGVPKMMATWMFVATFGDGTLALLPSSEGSDVATPACALLLDEEFSVVLRGTENLVEAITQKGFHFAYPVADVLQTSVWRVGVNLVLEGLFQGLFWLMAILPLWRLVRPSFASPLLQVIGTPVLVNFFVAITSFGSFVRYASRQSGGPLENMVQYFAQCTAEIVRSSARAAPIVVSWFLYIHEYSVFNELQLLVDLVSPLCLAFILSVPSRNYPIQIAKFLDVLGNPPVTKWAFRTPAAAATLQCLMICHDVRQRPVKEIDVRGVLSTLIPDQRTVWAAWRERVADRIIHDEGETSFAPTRPTFRDAKLQKQLEAYLAEAQYAYDVYRRWSDGLILTVEVDGPAAASTTICN